MLHHDYDDEFSFAPSMVEQLRATRDIPVVVIIIIIITSTTTIRFSPEF
jgi:hypothetical protein